MTLIIRPEEPGDHAAVFDVNKRAFDTPLEAGLVEKLRPVARPIISLVAVKDAAVVGHILFTPVTIRSDDGARAAMGLGPMAVVPEFQNQGIGSKLVLAGLEECRKIDQPVVFVLGHPKYYPRFGFKPVAPKGLHYKDEKYDFAFMVRELTPGALAGMSGYVHYLPQFDEAE